LSTIQAVKPVVFNQRLLLQARQGVAVADPAHAGHSPAVSSRRRRERSVELQVGAGVLAMCTAVGRAVSDN